MSEKIVEIMSEPSRIKPTTSVWLSLDLCRQFGLPLQHELERELGRLRAHVITYMLQIAVFPPLGFSLRFFAAGSGVKSMMTNGQSTESRQQVLESSSRPASFSATWPRVVWKLTIRL